MNRTNWTKYGWVLLLLAVGALWLRIENQQIGSSAHAAPSDVAAADAPLAPSTMAVVDVAVIFKGYNHFNSQMKRIKEDIEVFDSFVKRETQELKDLGELMKMQQPGSDDYKRLEAQATAKTTDLQNRVGLKKADLLKDEAEVYYDSYQKLQAAVKIVARKRKIGFVLRFNSDEMKRDDRNSVLQGVNRAVITYPTDNDITAAVLTELNRS
jgi:Skp family chaperone for outer membrane proteins